MSHELPNPQPIPDKVEQELYEVMDEEQNFYVNTAYTCYKAIFEIQRMQKDNPDTAFFLTHPAIGAMDVTAALPKLLFQCAEFAANTAIELGCKEEINHVRNAIKMKFADNERYKRSL